MALGQNLKSLYWRYLSSPRCDRVIYRHIYRQRPRTLVEIGMGSLERTRRWIETMQRSCGETQVGYTAIDLFDSRPPELPVLKLIETHRQLIRTGASIRLVPGEGNSVMAQVANSLVRTDLILISSCSDLKSQTQLWFYLPRMLHEHSRLFQQQTDTRGRRFWRGMSRRDLGLDQPRRARTAA